MRIPVLGQPRAQTRPLSTATPEVRNGNSLEPIEKGLGRLTRGAAQVAEAADRARREADDFRLASADLEAGRRINERLYAKDTGFLNQLGERGLDNAPVLEAIEKDLDVIQHGLPPTLQERFKLRRMRRVEDAWTTTERHSSSQRLRVYENVAEGQVGLALENARNEPDTVDSQVLKVLVGPEGEPGPLRRFLMAQGLPAERIQAEERAFQAQAYSAAMESYLAARNVDAAEGLLNRAKDRLGPKGPQYQKDIAAIREDQEAERIAVGMVESARDPVTGRVDAAKALKSVDSIPEGPKRDEALKRIEHRVRLADKEWDQRVHSVYARAFTAYLDTGALATVKPEDRRWLIDHAPEEWDKLRLKERGDLDFRRRQREQREDRARERETAEQRQALVEFRSELEEDPDRYRGMSVEEFTNRWGHRLSESGYKEAGRLFASRKREAPGSTAEFTRYVNDEVRGNDALKSKRRADKYRAMMGDLRRDFVAKNKREPSYEEIDALNARAWQETIKEGLLFDSTVPAFESRPTKSPAKAAPSATQAPPATPAKPSKFDRARALKREGKSTAEITRILNAEGY